MSCHEPTSERARIALAVDLSLGEVIEAARAVTSARSEAVKSRPLNLLPLGHAVDRLDAALATYDANAKRLADAKEQP